MGSSSRPVPEGARGCEPHGDLCWESHGPGTGGEERPVEELQLPVQELQLPVLSPSRLMTESLCVCLFVCLCLCLCLCVCVCVCVVMCVEPTRRSSSASSWRTAPPPMPPTSG